MKIPDELLGAYLNGELEGAERARIEQAIEQDARLARRVARQRLLRGRFRVIFGSRRQQPAAHRLLQDSRPLAATGSAQVIDLARARAERKRRAEAGRSLLSRRVALIAGIAGGVLLGVVLDRLAPDSALTQYHHGALFARGALADALNEQLAVSPSASTAVHIDMSFKTRSGNYCRTFSVRDAQALSGLACRQQGQWRVWTLDGGAVRASGAHVLPHRGALSPAVLQAISERISGPPLDARAEASARRSGWR